MKMKREIPRNYKRNGIRDDLTEFREMVDRPMGINTAVKTIIDSPSSALSFGRLICDGDWRIESRAAWALAYAAAKGIDISDTEEALLHGIDQQNSDLVKASAYALARLYYHKKDETSLEALKNHENPDVRFGSHLAFLDIA